MAKRTVSNLLAAALIWPVADLAVAPAQAQGIEFWNKPCLKAYKKWKTLGKHKEARAAYLELIEGGV